MQKKIQTKWEKNPPHTITFCKFNQEQIKMFKVLMKNKTKRNFFHAIIHYHYTQSLTERRLRTPPRHNMFCMWSKFWTQDTYTNVLVTLYIVHAHRVLDFFTSSLSIASKNLDFNIDIMNVLLLVHVLWLFSLYNSFLRVDFVVVVASVAECIVVFLHPRRITCDQIYD